MNNLKKYLSLDKNEDRHRSEHEQRQQQDDVYFLDRPQVLLQKDRLFEFYPSSDLPNNRRVNALVRFIIYFIILYFISNGPFLLLLMISVGAYLYLTRPRKHIEFSGGLSYKPTSCRQEEVCSMPTRENPFMNPSVDDYLMDVDRAPACPITNPIVSDKIDQIFSDNLYLDVNDVWERNNGQRQFVTQPNTTIPNDQGGFAQWLFGQPNNFCKEKSICKNDLPFTHMGPSG